MAALQRFKRDLNLCFSIFKRNFSDSALFQRAAAARFRKNRRKIFHKVMGAGLLVFTNQVQPFFALKKGAADWRYDMNEELTPQKERFLREVERKLLRKELDARLLEDIWTVSAKNCRMRRQPVSGSARSRRTRRSAKQWMISCMTSMVKKTRAVKKIII